MTFRSDTADTGAHGHRTLHPGQRTADTRTLRRHTGHWTAVRVDRHARTLDARSGHRTLAEDADTVTKARPASAPSGPPRPTAARWTPTVSLGTAPAARSNHDGSAVGHLPARDCRSQYQAPARPPRRPSRASAHCCPRKRLGSRVARDGDWHPLCKCPSLPVLLDTE
jgi:hypothetical protein